MMFWEVLLFAVVLSIDSFSAAFAMGFRPEGVTSTPETSSPTGLAAAE